MRSFFTKVMIIFKKEMTESFRDKILITSNFLIPFFTIPLLLLLVTTLKHKEMGREINRKYSILWIGDKKILPSMQKRLETHEKINLHYAPKEQFNTYYEIMTTFSREKKGRQSQKLAEDYEKRKIDLSVLVMPGDNENIYLTLFTNRYDQNSISAQEIIGSISTEINREMKQNRLKKMGKTEAYLRPVVMANHYFGNPRKYVAKVAGSPIGAYIIFILIVAMYYPTINATIGEKDNRTLKNLLMTPTSTVELLWGKFLNISLQGFLGLLPYVLNIAIIMFIVGSKIRFEIDYVINSNDVVTFLLFILNLIGINIFLAAFCFFTSSLAKTKIHAQSFLTILMLMAFLPIIVLNILTLETTYSNSLIPLLNFCLLSQKIVEGDLNTVWAFTVFFINIFYAIGLMRLANIFFKVNNLDLSFKKAASWQ